MLEIRTANGSKIQVQGAGLKALDIGLDELLMPLKRVYEGAMVEVRDEAQKNFPYNFRRSKSDQGRPHARDQFRIDSKKVIQNGRISLETSLYNDAEYAYMIKTSKKFESKTTQGSRVPLPQGAHVFSKLMWSPVRKAAVKVARDSANIFIDILRRAA